MKLVQSREANSFSGTQEIPSIVCNPKVHCRAHKNQRKRVQNPYHFSKMIVFNHVSLPSYVFLYYFNNQNVMHRQQNVQL
jgi:hypothetical protein